jgi:branched-chain amino acid transport system substrate-binding protein
MRSATCSSASASARADQLVNTVIKTYPNVSQFWTYDEKKFLSEPVYARDYPPAKYLE